MPSRTPREIKKLPNAKLLRERKGMRSGRYVNMRVGSKTWTQHLDDEIKRRKNTGKMKASAGHPVRRK